MADNAQPVTQESLEAQAGIHKQDTPQWSGASFDGYDSPKETVQPEPTPEVEAVAEAVAEEPQIQPEAVQQEQPVVKEEIIDIDTNDSVSEQLPEAQEVAGGLPDEVQKFLNFHNDTGGGAKEYLQYTRDFDSLDDTQILKEYYRQTKPGYTDEDINLVLDDKYGVEDLEEGAEMPREDRLKLLALKDEVVQAKRHLNESKNKYYSDVKSGVHGAPDQYKDAVEFYDNHQKQNKQQSAIRDTFIKESKTIFNEEFQGFQFDSSGKKYRVKVGNAEKVMESQLDLNNVIGEFLDDAGNVTDVTGWHKALWSAQNADKLFNAGIEAGKALALQERAKATKNPSYANTGPSKTPEKQKYRFEEPNQSNY